LPTRRSPSLTLATLILLAATAHATSGTVSILGDWKSPTNSIIRVYPCNPGGPTGDQTICLKIVRLEANAPATDQQNPDAAQRNRKLCGLTIGTGFHHDDPTHLSGGYLYDPKSGHTYHGAVALEGDTLKLRGYIGFSLFGRTETWQRVPTIEACK